MTVCAACAPLLADVAQLVADIATKTQIFPQESRGIVVETPKNRV
jgi:hypothetical protein